ncbi:MAG: alkaline phosphatase family protein [Bacteroidetes bacterium]|nr:alkaline phosphatase family protein [Bacteroidota bacterium]
MQRLKLFCLFALIPFSVFAQQPIARPKLVVGVVIDQMRWDYLYRYYDRYAPTGAFKRILNQGYSCENTMIPYAPTVTACGHSTIYTGSVPAISGITGNFWWDSQLQRTVYCTEDKSVNTVGSSSSQGKMSPANMFVNTIGDELRLATNFKGKVVGVAIKDRGGILPAGHSANAAYWYDNSTGAWITSTYYMNELPKWVSDFNGQKWVDKYYQQGWNLLYPSSTYMQSTADDKSYEAKPFGTGFPYTLSQFIGKDYGKIATTPMGNTLTSEFAKAAISNEQLGADAITDMITISYSSPDYIGHSFGPNSMEEEDNYLRLDKELGNLLDFLDAKVGKNQYTFFLSADHGVAHIPEFLKENKMPGGRLMMSDLMKNLNKSLNEVFAIPNMVLSDDNYQIHLNNRAIDSAKIEKKWVTGHILQFLEKQPAIARAFPLDQLNTVPLPATIRTMLNNGYYPSRNGDIQMILKPGYMDAWSNTGTTHGLWNPYDAHIPLLWYGWGIKQGKTNRETYMTDIAATLAAMLHIQMPNGCVGHTIPEVMK